jgi:hypothetical protein
MSEKRVEYRVVKGSDSGHCCFQWSIVSSAGDGVAEWWDETVIRLLAHLLNEYANEPA